MRAGSRFAPAALPSGAALTALLMTLASPLVAQAPAVCTFDRCGLRVQDREVYRGPGEDLVATTESVYPDVRFLVAAGDSAAVLAGDALHYAQRAVIAAGVASAAFAPAVVLLFEPRPTSDVISDEAWTALGLMVGGYVAAIIGDRWRRRVGAPLSRAVWHYNRAVVAGEVPGEPPELAPLHPADFGRTGLQWGLAAGTAAGFLIARHGPAGEDLWLEGFGLPWAGAAAGWLVGRLIRRTDP